MIVRELITKIGFAVDQSGARQADALTNKIKTNMSGIGTASASTGARFSRFMAGMSASMRPVVSGLENMGAGFSRSFSAMSAHTGRVTAGLGRIRSAIGGIAGALGPLAGAMAAAFSITAIKNAADEVMNLDGRLRTITATENERYQTEDKLFALAQNNRQSLSSMGDLYYKVARGARQFGVSQQDAMRVTDIVSKALTVGGASTTEAKASILQLGQALSSGVLQGDELRSLDENASLLMQHIASNMGVTIGDLKEMGREGVLTSQAVIQAILASGDAIDGEFGQMPMTIGQAETKIGNSWMSLIMKIQRDTGVFTEIATSIDQTFQQIFDSVDSFMQLWKGADAGDPESVLHINALREAHPILQGLVDVLKTVVGVFNEIGEATGIDNIIMKFALIAGAAVVLGGIIGIVGSAVSALVGVFAGLWGVVSGVISAILAAGWPVVAVIAAIASVVYYVKNNWDLVMATFAPGLKWMQDGLASLAEAWENIQPFITALMPLIKTIATLIGGTIVTAIGVFFDIAGFAFKAVSGLINIVATGLGKVGDLIQWCADKLAGLITSAQEFFGLSSKFNAEGSALERFARQTVNVSGGGSTDNRSYTFNVGSVQDGIGVASSLGISGWD